MIFLRYQEFDNFLELIVMGSRHLLVQDGLLTARVDLAAGILAGHYCVNGDKF